MRIVRRLRIISIIRSIASLRIRIVRIVRRNIRRGNVRRIIVGVVWVAWVGGPRCGMCWNGLLRCSYVSFFFKLTDQVINMLMGIIFVVIALIVAFRVAVAALLKLDGVDRAQC